MLRKTSNRAVSNFLYRTCFIRTFVLLWRPIECRHVTFINLDIYFSESIFRQVLILEIEKLMLT